MQWTLKRLEELRAELASGSLQLAELHQRQAAVREVVLRVQGAILVLEEQLAADPAFGSPAAVP